MIYTRHHVAVVGLGKISDDHMVGWEAVEHAKVKILVDTDKGRAEIKAEQYGIASIMIGGS